MDIIIKQLETNEIQLNIDFFELVDFRSMAFALKKQYEHLLENVPDSRLVPFWEKDRDKMQDYHDKFDFIIKKCTE